MSNIVLRRSAVSTMVALPNLAGTNFKLVLLALAMLFLAVPCISQDSSSRTDDSVADNSQASSTTASPTQPGSGSATVTLAAGTGLALVLSHPIQSRRIHRGDDIYAQLVAPVDSGDQVVIPPGTFIQGKVDKLELRSGRGELHLQSMAITFPDGYVTSVSGPLTIETDEGYALKDPGNNRAAAALLMPIGGAGIGALVGHFAANTQPSTITSSIPTGCTGPPPECISSSTSVPGSAAKDTIIGAGIGSAIGGIATLVLLTSSRNFYIEVGAPAEMVLPQPLSLAQREVAAAVQDAASHPVTPQPVAPLPPPPPISDTPIDHGTCYTPGTPGTPPTVIPGTPGPDGIPGPPTIIPGTPPTPGTPYPCP
jgi:hypothetical protein